MNTVFNNIEQVLSASRWSLDADSILAELIKFYSSTSRDNSEKSAVNALSPKDIEAWVRKNPKVFRIEPNGNISLKYDEVFRKTERLISNTFRDWKISNITESTFILLFLIKIISSKHLFASLGLPQSLLNLRYSKEKIFLILSSLNSHNETFRGCFDDTIKSWNKYKEWSHFEQSVIEVASIPDKLYGRYFSDFAKTSASKELAGFYEPNAILSEIVAQLAHSVRSTTVYDPFAGLGDFIIETNKAVGNRRYILGDNNESTSRIGKINLVLNGVQNFKYKTQDSLSEERKVANADLIITNPPFGLNVLGLSKKSILKGSDSSSTTHAILSVLNDLTQAGNAFVVVPESFLFHPNQHEIRRYLVKNRWVRTVISLPSDLLKPFSTVKISILHLCKEYDENVQTVRFIKETPLPTSSKEFGQYVSLLTSKFKYTEKSSEVVNAPITRILKGETELLMSRYSVGESKEYGNYALDSLIDFTSVQPSGVNFDKRIIDPTHDAPLVIRQTDLPKVIEDIYVDPTQVQRFSVMTHAHSKPIEYVTPNTVLFPRFGKNFLPALYDGDHKAVFDGTTIFAFRVDTKRVLPEYFVYQFYEPDVIQQTIRLAKVASHTQKISLNELLRVRLYIPSIEEQTRYIKDKKQTAIRDVKTANKEIAYEQFSTLKHSMAQPLDVIQGDINALFRFIDRRVIDKQALSGDDYVVPMLDESQRADWEEKRLNAYKERIKRNVEYLKDSLRKVNDIIQVNQPLQFEKVDLNALWKEVLEDNNDNIYTFRINGKKSTTIEGNKYLLKSAFAYLVENSIKHGFKREKRADYQEIIVDLEEQPNNQVLIWYRNNGQPFAKDFDLETIFERGRTSDNKSGSGFGGFVVHQIIVRHDGEIQPYSLSHDAYPVQFKISLPINHDQ